MSIIKHILFPCDFSEQGLLAVPFVRAIARRFDARVTLLGINPASWAEPVAALPNQPHPRLEILAQEFAGLPVQSVMDSGDPAHRIIEFAHGNAVDLIMMPTHDREFFRILLSGSVTEQVLHDAKCPVWTATYTEEQQSTPMPHSLLCAVDGTPSCLALLQWASGFSHESGADLKLIHVAPPMSDALLFSAEKAIQEEANERGRATIESLQRSVGIDAPLRVTAGPIADMVAEAAEEEGADLVLIGRGSLQATLGRLRTHAYAIIRKSPCPVLSV